jgi:disulfide bond formation protein DsbB
MTGLLRRPWLLPAVLAGAGGGALAVALAAQYWGGLEPCVLCIYQRYVYGVALAIGLVGAMIGRPGATRAVLALAGLTFLVGAGIAFFNVGVEQHWWRGTAECHAPSLDLDQSLDQLRESMLDTRFVPCDRVAWSLFGLSIAGYNTIFSLILAAASLWALRRLGRKEAA